MARLRVHRTQVQAAPRTPPRLRLRPALLLCSSITTSISNRCLRLASSGPLACPPSRREGHPSGMDP